MKAHNMLVSILLTTVSTVSSLSVQESFGNGCADGPKHWCSTIEHAKKCEINLTYCEKYCSDSKFPERAEGELCTTLIDATLAFSYRSLLGTNKCTFGPSYWCASVENAEECGVPREGCVKYCKNTMEYPDLVESDICLKQTNNGCADGPSYSCASFENADECGVDVIECLEHCAHGEHPENVKGDLCTWFENSTFVGSDDCVKGPSHWCASLANAKNCTITEDECTKYCNNIYEYPSLVLSDICGNDTVAVAGRMNCSHGPSYWCLDEDTAKECGVPEGHCDKYCIDIVQYPGLISSPLCEGSESSSPSNLTMNDTDPCTQGPSYYCASTANVALCNVDRLACEQPCTDLKEYPSLLDSDVCTEQATPSLPDESCLAGPEWWCMSESDTERCGIDECKQFCDDNNKQYFWLQNEDACT
eukprot:CFRG2152T1